VLATYLKNLFAELYCQCAQIRQVWWVEHAHSWAIRYISKIILTSLTSY